jgi:Lrp/AsnC family transcriptional regulator for asnA, asnC and gidA
LLNKKIDEIDAKILKILLKESRTSFTEIAKTCKISVCAARMRFNRLKEAGIITGANMHINPKFWGYEYTVDIQVETSLSNEEEVLELLRNKRYVVGAGKFGKYVMGFVVLSKLDVLRRIIEEIEANPKVKQINTLVWAETKNIHHPENLMINPFINGLEKSKKLEQAQPVSNEIDIDETDKQITKILAQDSRTPFNEIAKQLNISIYNVIQRYKRLREENVLTLSAITVSLEKLGYNAICTIFIKLEAKIKISKIREQLLQLPNVILLVEHVGFYDLRIDIPVTNIKEIFQVQEQIGQIPGIEKIEIAIMKLMPQFSFPFPLYNKLL